MALHALGQLQQPQVAADPGARLADLFGDLPVAGEAALLGERLETARAVDRVELLLVEVLDQVGEAGRLGIAEDRRDLGEAGGLGGAQATVAGHEGEVIAAAGHDDDRLHDADALQVGGEALDALLSMWVLTLNPSVTSIFSTSIRGAVG